ncbi:MAG: MoxR family ATPase, partial [Myxococcales bacterium]
MAEVVSLGSVQEAETRLRGVGYLPSVEIATSVFLADRLEKPVLVEGPAGVGKTELARAFAQAT